MDKKIDTLKALMAADEWDKAIKFAAKFPRLGNERDAILSAAAALLSPGLYRGMGRDPDALVANGKAALMARYPQ
jgi:hypothetical protein